VYITRLPELSSLRKQNPAKIVAEEKEKHTLKHVIWGPLAGDID
jgi:hypothetical protein